MRETKEKRFTAVGLFAGIGGLELGLAKAGFDTEMVCEIDPAAAHILSRRFRVEVQPDIRRLGSLPRVDVVAAGFPCQDLSQAGKTVGIVGAQSRLVGEVFKRLGTKNSGPRWLLLENVPFMLQLQQGRAMKFLVSELEALGFMWAYRVVDAQAFGLPQRRKRVLILASRTEDPRGPLFGIDAGEHEASVFDETQLCGFYWTEGLRGLGWAVDSIPTLKGGSGWGIPSPPAIWDPVGRTFSIPHINDAERLQGFSSDWTKPATEVLGIRHTHRWKLVGNAVSVPVARWIGERLLVGDDRAIPGTPLRAGASWPKAAWGRKGESYTVDVSAFPIRKRSLSLRKFLKYPQAPLSHRAALGFLSRAESSCLRFEKMFLRDLRRYVSKAESRAAA